MGFFKNFVNALKDPVNIVVAVVATAVMGPVGGFTFAQSVASALPHCRRYLRPRKVYHRNRSLEILHLSSDASGRTQMVKQPITSRRAVYGQTRVSGPLAFIESTDEDNICTLVVLLAAHECQEITTVYLNDEALTLDGSGNVTAPSRYANLVRVKKHLGTSNQSADSDLVMSRLMGWTDHHRLRGICMSMSGWSLTRMPSRPAFRISRRSSKAKSCSIRATAQLHIALTRRWSSATISPMRLTVSQHRLRRSMTPRSRLPPTYATKAFRWPQAALKTNMSVMAP